jgi:hypothetical protein
VGGFFYGLFCEMLEVNDLKSYMLENIGYKNLAWLKLKIYCFDFFSKPNILPITIQLKPDLI